MGAITREEVETFATHVLKELRLDWKMGWTIAQPGICLKRSKEILIPERMIGQYPWVAKEYVLHEVAHIFTDDKVHGEEFYKVFAGLVRRYLAGEPEGQALSGHFANGGHLHKLIRGCIQDFRNSHGNELTKDNMDSLARRINQNIKGVILKTKHPY